MCGPMLCPYFLPSIKGGNLGEQLKILNGLKMARHLHWEIWQLWFVPLGTFSIWKPIIFSRDTLAVYTSYL